MGVQFWNLLVPQLTKLVCLISVRTKRISGFMIRIKVISSEELVTVGGAERTLLQLSCCLITQQSACRREEAPPEFRRAELPSSSYITPPPTDPLSPKNLWHLFLSMSSASLGHAALLHPFICFILFVFSSPLPLLSPALPPPPPAPPQLSCLLCLAPKLKPFSPVPW